MFAVLGDDAGAPQAHPCACVWVRLRMYCTIYVRCRCHHLRCSRRRASRLTSTMSLEIEISSAEGIPNAQYFTDQDPVGVLKVQSTETLHSHAAFQYVQATLHPSGNTKRTAEVRAAYRVGYEYLTRLGGTTGLWWGQKPGVRKDPSQHPPLEDWKTRSHADAGSLERQHAYQGRSVCTDNRTYCRFPDALSMAELAGLRSHSCRCSATLESPRTTSWTTAAD